MVNSHYDEHSSPWCHLDEFFLSNPCQHGPFDRRRGHYPVTRKNRISGTPPGLHANAAVESRWLQLPRNPGHQIESRRALWCAVMPGETGGTLN